MELNGGMLVVVRYGCRGTQIARLLRRTNTRWIAEKWLTGGRRWTGEVPVEHAAILRPATEQDCEKRLCEG